MNLITLSWLFPSIEEENNQQVEKQEDNGVSLLGFFFPNLFR